MTDTVALKQLIKRSGLKYRFIASELGITYQGLKNKIENVSEFKTGEVDALCRLLMITSLRVKEEIFFAKEVDLKSTKLINQKETRPA